MTSQASTGPPRLNRIIELWQRNKSVFGTMARFRDEAGAIYYAGSQQDFVIFDLEHLPSDFTQFRSFLQYMIDPASILKKGSLQPNVMPLARIPSNGAERNQWLIKQVLDVGAYGFLAPHIKNAEDARALIANSRYPNELDDGLGGDRGLSPFTAARYWGVPVTEYIKRAGTWPLDPDGELTVIAMIESVEGVKNVREILRLAKGIAAILIGAYDLSSSLGYPGQMDHPETEKAIQMVLEASQELQIPCGIPVNRGDIQKRLEQGFKFLIVGGTPGEVEEAIRLGRKISGRE